MGATTIASAFQSTTALNSLLKVYPNPASSRIFIQLLDKNDTISLMELYNAVGKLVFTKKSYSKFEELNVANYVEGLYKLRVVTAEGYTQTRSINLIK